MTTTTEKIARIQELIATRQAELSQLNGKIRRLQKELDEELKAEFMASWNNLQWSQVGYLLKQALRWYQEHSYKDHFGHYVRYGPLSIHASDRGAASFWFNASIVMPGGMSREMRGSLQDQLTDELETALLNIANRQLGVEPSDHWRSAMHSSVGVSVVVSTQLPPDRPVSDTKPVGWGSDA